MKTAFQHACFAGLSAFQLLVLAEVLISEGVSLSVLKSVSLREG
jgi:hypothetical protein